MPHATSIFDEPMNRDWDAHVFPASYDFPEEASFYDKGTQLFESTSVVDPSLFIMVEAATPVLPTPSRSKKRSASSLVGEDGDEGEIPCVGRNKKSKVRHAGEGEDAIGATTALDLKSDGFLTSASSTCHIADEIDDTPYHLPLVYIPPARGPYLNLSRPLNPSPLSLSSSSIRADIDDDDDGETFADDAIQNECPSSPRSPSPPRNTVPQLELVKLALDPWLKLYRSLHGTKGGPLPVAVTLPNPATFPRCGNIRDLRNPLSTSMRSPIFPLDPALSHC